MIRYAKKLYDQLRNPLEPSEEELKIKKLKILIEDRLKEMIEEIKSIENDDNVKNEELCNIKTRCIGLLEGTDSSYLSELDKLDRFYDTEINKAILHWRFDIAIIERDQKQIEKLIINLKKEAIKEEFFNLEERRNRKWMGRKPWDSIKIRATKKDDFEDIKKFSN